MRLSKIDNPEHPEAVKAYEKSKTYFGKVITPMKVVYARVPSIFKVSNALNEFFFNGTTVNKNILELVKGYTAVINNCKFCIDIGRSLIQNDKELLLKYDSLTNSDLDENLYKANELAALHYAEEATKYRKVSNETFMKLKKYFSDNEIAEIVLTCAIENYYNVINTSLEIESDHLSTYEQENSLSN